MGRYDCYGNNQGPQDFNFGLLGIAACFVLLVGVLVFGYFCGWVDTNDAQHSEIRKLWATLWPKMAAREKGKE